MRFKMSEPTFTMIPEGWYVFKIVGIDESKYEKYGKLGIKLETANGLKHTENFTLVTTKGEVNDGAVKALSYFMRTALNDYSNMECDTEDLIGRFIRAEVKHVVSDKINEKTGKPYVNVNLGDKEPASGFDMGDDDELEELDE